MTYFICLQLLWKLVYDPKVYVLWSASNSLHSQFHVFVKQCVYLENFLSFSMENFIIPFYSQNPHTHIHELAQYNIELPFGKAVFLLL